MIEPAKKHSTDNKESSKILTLGFSPCPNDTFMFDALVNEKIDTNGFSFDVKLSDIEKLNQQAINGELDITKISFGVYLRIKDTYELLTAGSALGIGVGPLLISKKEFSNPQKEIKTVAIPGKNTTAYFLFKMFYPELNDIREIIFSDIERAVLEGEVDAGVIIHENRFTYQLKALKKVSDLGELWENKTGQPIPLGGIAIKRNLDDAIKRNVNALIRKSVEFAFANPEESSEYVAKHAQEMSEEVRKKHIQLYVNNFSIDIGEIGKNAILKFFDIENSNEIDKQNKNLFVI